MAVLILAWTISYLDSAGAGEAAVVVVVVRFLDLEGEGLSRALGVVRMVHHQCHQLRVEMVRACVVGSKVTTGLIDVVGEMVVVGEAVVDTMVVGAREDLVVAVAHGGMDQVVEWVVGVDATELFTFYDLLSVGLAFFLSLVYARFAKGKPSIYVILCAPHTHKYVMYRGLQTMNGFPTQGKVYHTRPYT